MAIQPRIASEKCQHHRLQQQKTLYSAVIFYTPDVAIFAQTACTTVSEPAERPSRHPRATMSFAELGLSPAILEAVAEQGYDKPSPIQEKAIPAVLTGQDVMAAA